MNRHSELILLRMENGPTRRGGAHRTLQPEAAAKRCPKCNVVKAREAFGLNKYARDLLTSDCKDCRNSYARSRHKEDPEIRYGKHLKKRYAIGIDEYQRLYREQNGVCAVCRRTGTERQSRRPLHLDHDHSSGRVRGLLCQPCNCALGNAQDDPARLRALADYVEKHR